MLRFGADQSDLRKRATADNVDAGVVDHAGRAAELLRSELGLPGYDPGTGADDPA